MIIFSESRIQSILTKLILIIIIFLITAYSIYKLSRIDNEFKCLYENCTVTKLSIKYYNINILSKVNQN